MPIYRVSITNAATGTPGEILVEAEGRAEARNIAASRGYRSTTISVVGEDEPVDDAALVRKAERFQPVPSKQGVTVIQIALGVFLGLTMFFICLAVVSCVAGGRVYIG